MKIISVPLIICLTKTLTPALFLKGRGRKPAPGLPATLIGHLAPMLSLKKMEREGTNDNQTGTFVYEMG